MSLAFDWDPDACASYSANIGHAPIRMDAKDLLRLAQAGWFAPWVAPWRDEDRAIDLLIADPPCTPWSRAGKRLGQEDDRDMLAVTCALVRALQPRAFLIANVPGLDDGPNWPVVQKTIGALSRFGYCIDFARLDAADYGVPQHRVRPFWFGHRKGSACLRWPERTHAPPEDAQRPALPGIGGLLPYVTCREALRHLGPGEIGSPIRLRWRGEANKTGKGPRASHLDRPAHVVTAREGSGDGSIVFDGPNHRPSKLDSPARTSDGGGAKGARVMAWPWDRPATTITSGDRIAPPGHHDERGSVLTYANGSQPKEHAGQFGPNAIKLSEKAAAILQGFPEGWVFAGKTKRARWGQIGMAMPPPLAEAVGRQIAKQTAAPVCRANVHDDEKCDGAACEAEAAP